MLCAMFMPSATFMASATFMPSATLMPSATFKPGGINNNKLLPINQQPSDRH
jgi:hypothetical protein